MMQDSHRMVTLLDLLEVNAEAFWRLSSIVGQLLVRLETSLPPIDQVAASLAELRKEAEKLGVRSAVTQIDRINDLVKNGSWNSVRGLGDAMRPLVHDLYLRVNDELSGRFFLSIPPDRASLYAQDRPLFGDDVSNKFSVVSFDISEAGKCLALGRATASAFHSIRSLEAAIRAISRCLGIPDPTKQSERSWFKMLDAIDKKIKQNWPTTSDRTHGDGFIFEHMHATLSSLQNPWRNATMHLDQKYTDEEAANIFNAVGHFFREVATRMDENGQPNA